MIMQIKEQILAIPDLIITEEKNLLTDNEWNEYIEQLKVFVVSYPSKEMMIRQMMNNKNIDSVLKNLASIGEMLKDIHADEMADEIWRRLTRFDKSKPDRIESYVSFLLSNVSTLSIDIQMALSTREPNAAFTQDFDMPRESRIQKNIMAVDDDPYCLYTFKAAVSELPCKVIAVNSGKEALNMLSKIKPHLFVLDIEMPSMSGIELAKTLRKQGQAAPIIFLTRVATMETVQECLQLGASDFIVKPVNAQNVAMRISKFL